MATDLQRRLRLGLGYPGGINFDYHSWALAVYLDSLEESINSAQKHYRLRAKRALEKVRDEYPCPVQYADEEDLIDRDADEHIPRYAHMSALVPIWGIFESTVDGITGYVSKREAAKVKFKEIRAQDFLRRVEKYYGGVLKISLPWSKKEKKQMDVLYIVRNAIAHRNGQFLDASEDRKKEIRKAVNATSGLSIVRGTLVVSAEYVRSAANLVFKLIDELNQIVVERYDGPTIREEEA